MNQMNQSKSPSQEPENTSWMKVLFEIIIKVLTFGFYHIEKHQKK